jgi:hypothetical protein
MEGIGKLRMQRMFGVQALRQHLIDQGLPVHDYPPLVAQAGHWADISHLPLFDTQEVLNAYIDSQATGKVVNVDAKAANDLPVVVARHQPKQNKRQINNPRIKLYDNDAQSRGRPRKYVYVVNDNGTRNRGIVGLMYTLPEVPNILIYIRSLNKLVEAPPGWSGVGDVPPITEEMLSFAKEPEYYYKYATYTPATGAVAAARPSKALARGKGKAKGKKGKGQEVEAEAGPEAGEAGPSAEAGTVSGLQDVEGLIDVGVKGTATEKDEPPRKRAKRQASPTGEKGGAGDEQVGETLMVETPLAELAMEALPMMSINHTIAEPVDVDDAVPPLPTVADHVEPVLPEVQMTTPTGRPKRNLKRKPVYSEAAIQAGLEARSEVSETAEPLAKRTRRGKAKEVIEDVFTAPSGPSEVEAVAAGSEMDIWPGQVDQATGSVAPGQEQLLGQDSPVQEVDPVAGRVERGLDESADGPPGLTASEDERVIRSTSTPATPMRPTFLIPPLPAAQQILGSALEAADTVENTHPESSNQPLHLAASPIPPVRSPLHRTVSPSISTPTGQLARTASETRRPSSSKTPRFDISFNRKCNEVWQCVVDNGGILTRRQAYSRYAIWTAQTVGTNLPNAARMSVGMDNKTMDRYFDTLIREGRLKETKTSTMSLAGIERSMQVVYTPSTTMPELQTYIRNLSAMATRHTPGKRAGIRIPDVTFSEVRLPQEGGINHGVADDTKDLRNGLLVEPTIVSRLYGYVSGRYLRCAVLHKAIVRIMRSDDPAIVSTSPRIIPSSLIFDRLTVGEWHACVLRVRYDEQTSVYLADARNRETLVKDAPKFLDPWGGFAGYTAREKIRKLVGSMVVLGLLTPLSPGGGDTADPGAGYHQISHGSIMAGHYRVNDMAPVFHAAKEPREQLGSLPVGDEADAAAYWLALRKASMTASVDQLLPILPPMAPPLDIAEPLRMEEARMLGHISKWKNEFKLFPGQRKALDAMLDPATGIRREGLDMEALGKHVVLRPEDLEVQLCRREAAVKKRLNFERLNSVDAKIAAKEKMQKAQAVMQARLVERAAAIRRELHVMANAAAERLGVPFEEGMVVYLRGARYLQANMTDEVADNLIRSYLRSKTEMADRPALRQRRVVMRKPKKVKVPRSE